MTTTDAASDAAITVEGLTKRFGDVEALAGIDLQVRPGEIFGLLGPNGAGKTTAVRILTTILKSDGGRATVLGHDVARQPQAVRERIGLAGQYAAVDENLTGRENLRLIGKLTHVEPSQNAPRAAELLDVFGLADAADRPAKTYSGGMRRRLDLAAALVHRPPVLFLDEPTTGLDIASRTDLWGVIEQLTTGGTTVLLTTQYLEEADQLADQLAVIDQGKVIARGAPAELKAESGTTVIDVRFADAADALRAGGILATADHPDPRVENNVVELPISDGAGAVVSVVRALDEAGLPPVTINVREPTLDDVFLRLTGHRAEVQEPDPADPAATAEPNGAEPHDALDSQGAA